MKPEITLQLISWFQESADNSKNLGLSNAFPLCFDFFFLINFFINGTLPSHSPLPSWNPVCLEEDGISTKILYWSISLGTSWLLCSLPLWSVLYRIFSVTVSACRIKKARSIEVQWNVQMLQVSVLAPGAEMAERDRSLSALTCPNETMRFSGLSSVLKPKIGNRQLGLSSDSTTSIHSTYPGYLLPLESIKIQLGSERDGIFVEMKLQYEHWLQHVSGPWFLMCIKQALFFSLPFCIRVYVLSRQESPVLFCPCAASEHICVIARPKRQYRYKWLIPISSYHSKTEEKMELKFRLSCPNQPCRFNDAEHGRVTYTWSHQEELHFAPLLLIPVSVKGLN